MKQITTSDLRLGNWLYYTKETMFPMQVYALGNDWVQLDFEGNEGDCLENNSDEIYPIPITFKLLNGICYSNKDSYKTFSCRLGEVEFHTEIKNGFLELYPSVNEYEYIIGEPIKYVHELQNLYHALTGKELIIRREWL